jgi:hypothetical protein
MVAGWDMTGPTSSSYTGAAGTTVRSLEADRPTTGATAMTTWLIGAFLTPLILLLARQAPTPVRPFDPTSDYHERDIQGFTVLVSRHLLEHKREANVAIRELESQLERIGGVVPPRPLAELRKVRIWMEWANRPDRAAEFHPSARWLRENGYNPEKAGCIEIANARNFTKWSREDQPWATFHELAHAYHFRVLGERSQRVLNAYRHAMDNHLYDSVRYVHGGTKRAYAAENAKEYFAEISEAYFGKNDFYPFTRADLKKHDHVGFHLMEQVWGLPRDGTSDAPARRSQSRAP